VTTQNGGRETGPPTALDMLRSAMEAEWPDGAATADVLAEKYGPMEMSPETTRQLLRDLLALARSDIAIDLYDALAYARADLYELADLLPYGSEQQLAASACDKAKVTLAKYRAIGGQVTRRVGGTVCGLAGGPWRCEYHP
jgi:hypothetical protein